jgi:hypothetical protein
VQDAAAPFRSAAVQQISTILRISGPGGNATGRTWPAVI